MINFTLGKEKVNSEKSFLVCADVSKNDLNVFAETEVKCQTVIAESHLGNNKKEIKKMLKDYSELGKKHGKNNMVVICEPTGKYHRSLTEMARKEGHQTAFVFGQSVNRMQVVESNDTGKTDTKDPRVINLLAKMNKVFCERELDCKYQTLRLQNKLYDEEENTVVRIKNHVESIMIELFPDWSLRNDLFYGKLAEGLMAVYQFNPRKIVAEGRRKFFAVVEKYSPRTHKKTRKEIWECAKSSALHTLPSRFEGELENRLKELFEDIDHHETRKKELKRKMILIYKTLEEAENFEEFIIEKDFMMARLIAETGPLCDFDNYRQLLRYVGLNLREKESGKFKGKLKITKRGRSLFRKVMWRVVMGLIGQKESMMHSRHKKKKKELGCGGKAVVANMRFLVKCLFGVFNSEKPYDPSRVFIDEGRHEKQIEKETTDKNAA